MTTAPTRLSAPPPAPWPAPSRRSPLLIMAVAVVAGLVLGDADLLLQIALPYPWANLANSSAVWALAAFGYGAWVRRPGALTAAGGAVLLVVAVAFYYLTAAAVRGDDVSVVWSQNSLLWGALGVVAGVVFAPVGSWCRTPGWRGVVAAAAAAAVCWAEAAVGVVRNGADTGAALTDVIQTAVITVVLGLVVLTVAARRPAVIARALALAVPLTVLGFGGFAAAGFTGPLT